VSTERTVAFAYTARQARRARRGLVGVAAIFWSVGLVHQAVVGRLHTAGGWTTLLVLACLLGIVVVALSNLRRFVVLRTDAVDAHNGPRHWALAWSEITDVEVRERGVARRVVLHAGSRRRVLPVPLTGGSLLGPGADPDLDEKVELIRQWWADQQGS
jgi:hypothetical protein